MRHGVDSGDHFFQIVEYQHGHEGTEDLFLHHRIGKSNIIKDSGFNAQSLSVRDASVDHFLFIDQPQDPVKVFFIDDLPRNPDSPEAGCRTGAGSVPLFL